MNYPNLYTLFCKRAAQYAAREAFFVRERGIWRGISWASWAHDAERFASALLALNLTRGASVCILMSNVPEWCVADIGTIAAGGVGVGLYATSSAEQCGYIINHSDAEFVLVDTRAQLEKMLSIRPRLTKVKALIALDAAAANEAKRLGANVWSYADFLQFGGEQAKAFADLVRERGLGARADETAIMVYTSGTTGLPKGACLSHAYVINSVESLRATVPIEDTDVAFSYLPYCHVAERISGLYNRLYAGCAAYFVDDIARLYEYMREVRPTVFASLPRFFEKIHARLVADLESAPADERRRFYDALGMGRRIAHLRQTRAAIPSDLWDEYVNWALPVLQRLKDCFGGRIRLVTSGGAPLPSEIEEFFDAAGLPILQAYGLTENICVAFNRLADYKHGTVGRPMPGCEVRIAADGEIQVRSAMMFSGYYKEPEKTAEVMRDGWLLTGDVGELDAEGFLKITGRKKELIVTSTGKKIAPSLVENLIKEHHLISQAFVYGEGKSYLVALITLNQSEAEAYARAHHIAYQNFAELTRNAEILRLVHSIIERANARLSSTEAVKKFRILERDFQVELDEVTPTLKIKRNVVAARHAKILQSLYE